MKATAMNDNESGVSANMDNWLHVLPVKNSVTGCTNSVATHNSNPSLKKLERGFSLVEGYLIKPAHKITIDCMIKSTIKYSAIQLIEA
jgi:hypothetical protein